MIFRNPKKERKNGLGWVPIKLYLQKELVLTEGCSLAVPALRETQLASEDTTGPAAFSTGYRISLRVILNPGGLVTAVPVPHYRFSLPPSYNFKAPLKLLPSDYSIYHSSLCKSSIDPRLFLLMPVLTVCTCMLSLPFPDTILSDSAVLSLSCYLGKTQTQVINSTLQLPSSNWTWQARNLTSYFNASFTSKEPLSAAWQSHYISLLSSTLQDNHFTPPPLFYKPLPPPLFSQSLLTCLSTSFSLPPSFNHLFSTPDLIIP